MELFRKTAINTTFQLVKEYRELFRATTNRQLRINSISIPPESPFEITQNFHIATQTPHVVILSADQADNINTLFGITRRPTLQNDDIITDDEGWHHAASDASLDKLHGIVFVAYAVVYGPFSRFNFDNYIPYATSTLEGESTGLREGIMYYFQHIARPQSKLTIHCDNLAAVENVRNLIEYADGNDYDNEYIQFQLDYLDASELNDKARFAEFIECLKINSKRLKVLHVKVHVASPHTIAEHLNDLADRNAKRALTSRFKSMPIMSENSMQTSEAYVRMLSQQGATGIRF